MAKAPVDVAWLATFRILYGLTMFTSMVRFIAYGWIDDFFVKPAFHFKYLGFGWVEPLPPLGMHALFWGLAALGLMIAAGFYFRVAAALFVVGVTYVQLIDVATYLNHYYLAGLLAMLLAVSPAHRAWSIDAYRARSAAMSVPSGWLYLFRFQVGVVYTFAGLAKANADWLVHAQPLRIWLGSKSGMPILGPLFEQAWAAPLMSWTGFLFDTSIVWLLLVRRIRPFAYVAVIVFHILTRALFSIGMFPVIMILSALVFFPPDWPRTLLSRLSRPLHLPVPVRVPVPVPAKERARLRDAAVPLALAYCALQLLLPLRFLAYGGDVRWHEQGMRFSWRVMVREKNGSITFIVHSKERDKTWHVAPRTVLTAIQEREMSGQPDLILQLAHHIRDDFARKGHGQVEVRVDALVSLNGRRLAPVIDPNVDLASVEDGIEKATWILPAPATSPPHIHPI